MGQTRHIAHAEGWLAVAIEPDLCKVGKCVVAFNSFARLDYRHAASPDVKARGTPVYRVGDLFKTTQANAGAHIVSGTALASGYLQILEGHANVKINAIPVARHDSACRINCDSTGMGGARGQIVTMTKAVAPAAAKPAAAPSAVARVSKKLLALKALREALLEKRLNLDGLDGFFDFDSANATLNGWIKDFQASPGTVRDWDAQLGRAALGATKDFVMGLGELAYEALKGVPKLAREMTPTGSVLASLDRQILAEEISLGNVDAPSLAKDVMGLAKAIMHPVSDPWMKGQYVEAGARAGIEVVTFWSLPSKAARAAKAKKLLDLAKAKDAAASAPAAKIIIAPASSITPAARGGVYISLAPKRVRPPPNGFDGPNGYKTLGINKGAIMTPEGRKLINAYTSQGMDFSTSARMAEELIESGSTLPKAIDLVPGDVLYKVVPEGKMPGQYSAFFATKEELSSLKKMSYDQISDRIGIPLESQQTLRFDIVEVVATKPVTVFESVIAPTVQNGYRQPGGGIQTLITNRRDFTAPVVIGQLP
jgi:uncharacterized Zn-binding protein involved in type VI secretion